MANKELVTVLTVKTEQSQNTIKGLKKEIADLKKQMDSAIIGSEEFETASRDLANAQAELKSVMADGKKTTDAVEGSYNHLVATMAELKKQWKATADEVKRNELGKQIDSINDRLKGLDGSIGNFQRNVGNYAEDFKKAMQEQADSTVIVKTKLEAIQKVATGLASGYAAVQGAMNLLNIENAEFEKAMIKVQSAMAIAQGIGGMKDLIEGAGTLKVAFGSAGMAAKTMAAETAVASTAMNGAAASTVVATTAMERFKLALIKTGIGALIVGIGVAIAYVVENWDKLKKSLGFDDTLKRQAELAKEAAEQMQEFRKSVAGTASSVLAKYQILQTAYKSLKNEHQKKEWIEQNKTEFEKLGLSVNTLNEAEDTFVKNTDKIVDAMIKRAMATAKEQQLVELTAKYLEEQAKAEDLYNKSKHKANDKNFSMSHDARTGDEYLDRDGYWRFTEQGAKKANEKLKKSVFETANNYKAQMNKLANDIVAINAETEGTISNGSGKKTGAGSGSDNTEDNSSKAKEIAEKARKAVIDTKEEELAELKRIYDEEKLLLEQYGIDTVNLTEVYNQKVSEIEQKYNSERDAAWKTIQDAKKSDKELEIEKLVKEKEKYLELFQDEKEKLLAIEEWYRIKLQEIDEKYDTGSTSGSTVEKTPEQYIDEYGMLFQKIRESAGNTAAYVGIAFTQALNSATQIIGALQAGIDTTTEEGFEKNKKMQKAQAWINIAQGILTAISTGMQLGPILGPIIGGINAATVATVGGIQISNINKQKFNSESPFNDVSGVGVSPSINMADAMPIQYTRELLTDTETTNINKEQRVVVVESDITNTQDKVRVAENNSSF